MSFFKAICKVDVIFFFVVLMIIFIPSESLEQNNTANGTISSTVTSNYDSKTTNSGNTSPESKKKSEVTTFIDSLGKNKDMLLRALYVLIAVTTIVIIYFGIKAWRVHKRKSKSRKYGIITKGADLEMEPLGKGDDDEEDLTVFEINNKTKKK